MRAANASARIKKVKKIMQNFSELQISAYTKERLTAASFMTPTPVQAAALPQALEGKDVLASAQTGTGKTLAFPDSDYRATPEAKKRLELWPWCLVPTRELAMQVVEHYDRLRGRNFHRRH